MDTLGHLGSSVRDLGKPNQRGGGNSGRRTVGGKTFDFTTKRSGTDSATVDDVFTTSNNPSGRGNLFSLALHHVEDGKLSSTIKPRGSRSHLRSSPMAVEENEDTNGIPHGKGDESEDAEKEGDWAQKSDLSHQQGDYHHDSERDLEDDYEDIEEDPEELEGVLTLSAPDGKERVGPYHENVPQAMNVMHKYRNKQVAGQDPNGRKVGRNLVMWHRPRMMDKLILHIQYECHLAKIRLPWDKIAHRLHPGASGPAVIQFLNKNRDVLVQEGHMIPPNMGKSKAVYDETIRGYVRDESQDIPTVVRILPWDERYEDRLESLVVPGLIKGSGRYNRDKANRVEVPKETGRRSRVPPQTKEKMAVNRSMRNRKSGDLQKNSAVKKEGSVKKQDSTKRADSPGSPTVKEEVDPAELDSDDDYNPGATLSNKRKAKGVPGSRKKARGVNEASSIEVEGAATPAKRIRQPSSAAESTIKSTGGSKAMASLSIETPTKNIEIQQIEQPTVSAIEKHTGAINAMSFHEKFSEDDDQTIELVSPHIDEDGDQGVQENVMGSLESQSTPPFGASSLDVQAQIRAGHTPPYNSQYYNQQISSPYAAGGNPFSNFPGLSADQYPSGGTSYQLSNPYGSGLPSGYYGSSYAGVQSRGNAPPTAAAPAPGSYADRQRQNEYVSAASAMLVNPYLNQSAYAVHQPSSMGHSFGTGNAFVHPGALMYNPFQPPTFTNSNSFNTASTGSTGSTRGIPRTYAFGDPSLDQENLPANNREIDRDEDDQMA